MKYPKGIRGRLDKIFSKCVRERSNWFCEFGDCETNTDYRYRPRGLHCSHFHGRGHMTLRWNPLNAHAHCAHCHFYVTNNPEEFVIWARLKIGEGSMDILRERKRDARIRYRTKDFENMYRHYVTELETMKQKRLDGVVGRIEFQAYD